MQIKSVTEQSSLVDPVLAQVVLQQLLEQEEAISSTISDIMRNLYNLQLLAMLY